MSLKIQALHSGKDGYFVGNLEEGKNGVSENGNIYAGNLKIKSNIENAIDQKRQNARNQAMRLIRDAWTGDEKALQNLDEMNQSKAESLSKMHEYEAGLKEIEENKKKVQEEYGIDKESQEQRDLELLEKYQNYVNGSRAEQFSKEDIQRLKELENKPWSEYQSKVLQLNASTGTLQKLRDEQKEVVRAASEAITDAKIEQLKSQDMAKAQDAAESIMDASDDEIIGVLVGDAVEHIDEVQEEAQEKAEEAQEKKDEHQEKLDKTKEKKNDQQERVEEVREDRKNQQKILEGVAAVDQFAANMTMEQKSAGSIEDAQKHIQRILQDNNLVNEDLKGIKIDFNF